MATAITHPATPPPDETSFRLESPRSLILPVPNKHIPFCPTGPSVADAAGPSTPPDTPPSKDSAISRTSVLQALSSSRRVVHDPPVYSIDGDGLEEAIEAIASEPVADTADVFPWLHGLHEENQMQIAFFAARRRSQREPPRCVRSLMIVKAGGDLSRRRLKGAVSPDEILSSTSQPDIQFLDADPREGFSVRNFQIQIAKAATVSDIIVYRDGSADLEDMFTLATKLAFAQRNWRVKCKVEDDVTMPAYNVFVLEGKLS